MHTQSKTWSDKADKDLFFTILQIKNIGVISGPEWTIIGEHMRRSGYTFTNEGCRQHFQGLRRTQMKAEAEGTSASTSSVTKRVADPSQNPITRRPGPGRGTPRYKGRNNDGSPIVPASQRADDAQASSAQPITTSTTAAPLPVLPTSGSQTSIPSDTQSPPVSATPAAPMDASQHYSNPSQDAYAEDSAPISMASLPSSMPQADTGMVLSTGDGEEGNAEEDADGEEETGEPMAKRQRIDDAQDLTTGGPMDDESLLQLAAHGGDAPGDHYGAEYHYGEA